MSQENQPLVHAVVRLGSVLLREGRPLLARFGLSESQFNLLRALANSEGGLSQRELSESLIVDSSNITGLVDRLERKRLVRRMPDPEDRRRHRVVLTAAGHALLKKVEAPYSEAVSWLENALTPSERRTALDLLSRIEARAIEGGRTGRF